MIPFEIIQQEMKDYDENIWQQMEERSELYIEHFKEKSKCTINFKEDKYILICPLGDQHLGHDGTAYKLAREHAQMIGNCEYAVAFDASDTTDNFINSKILEAIINSATTPKQQIKMLQTYIDFFNGHYILSVSGNHQNWSKKVTGVDWLAEFMKKNDIIYNRDELRIYINVNDQEYSGKLRHKMKNKSMYNKTHELKQNQRFYSDEVFDFLITGHYHEAAIEQSRTLGKVQTYIKTGTYTITDPHAYEIGFGFGYADMPCFILNPFVHELLPFYHIEDGIKVVELLNKEL